MPKNLLPLVLFICMHSCAMAKPIEEIYNFIQKKYADTLTITQAQVEQLSWAYAHVSPTNDLDLFCDVEKNFIEIARALNRIYCAKLLRTGNIESYNRFVRAQIESGAKDVLKFATFNEFGKHIQQLTKRDYELLETAIILSAVSLSNTAANLNSSVNFVEIANDKMDFLASSIRQNSYQYPLINHNQHDYKLLYISFLPHTNFRHMLYTEGGIDMFTCLRHMIMHGFIDKEKLDFWYAYWLINISGYRGHVNHNGSLYLHEHTAQSTRKLKELIYKMLEFANINPLFEYLEYRAQMLGFTNLPTEDKLFITHIACLLRIYDADNGKKLSSVIHSIDNENLNNIREYFSTSLYKECRLLYTHVPAFLNNSLSLLQGDMQSMLTMILPVYNQIIKISQNLQLSTISFEKLATNPNIKRILQTPIDQLKFTFNNDGLIELAS